MVRYLGRNAWRAAVDTALALLSPTDRAIVVGVLDKAMASGILNGRSEAGAIRHVLKAVLRGSSDGLVNQALSSKHGALGSRLDPRDHCEEIEEVFDEAGGQGGDRTREAREAALAAQASAALRERRRGEDAADPTEDLVTCDEVARTQQALRSFASAWDAARVAYRDRSGAWLEQVSSGGNFSVGRHPGWPPWTEAEMFPVESCCEREERFYCSGCRLWFENDRQLCPSCGGGVEGRCVPIVLYRRCDACGTAEAASETRRFIFPVAPIQLETFNRQHVGWACGSDRRGCRSAVLRSTTRPRV